MNEPRITLNYNGEEAVLTRDNAHLYTHGAAHQEFDHVFHQRGLEKLDEFRHRRIGAFIFRCMSPDFNDMADFMLENDYPRDHRFEASEEDQEAYFRAVGADLQTVESVPDEWLK